MLKLAGSLLLLITLFWIVSPPRFLGAWGRGKAIVGALIGCALLIATGDGQSIRSEAQQSTSSNDPRSDAQKAAAAVPPASSPVKAMLGRANSLFVEIRNTKNVYCAADGPSWVVGELNGEFVALNGTARNWAKNQHLSVYHNGKWTLVADRGVKPFNLTSDEVWDLIKIGNQMCPSSANILDEAAARVKEGEKRFASRASEFGLQASSTPSSSGANGPKLASGFIYCVRKWSNKFQRLTCFANEMDLGDAERCRKIPSFDEKVACFDQFAAPFESERAAGEPLRDDIKEAWAGHLAKGSTLLKEGQKVRTMGGMGCFRFSDQEYRCVKQGLHKAVVIAAADVDEPEKQYLDQHCFTFIRGFKDPKCGFNATFVVTGSGIDHMESTFFYYTDRMKLKKY